MYSLKQFIAQPTFRRAFLVVLLSASLMTIGVRFAISQPTTEEFKTIPAYISNISNEPTSKAVTSEVAVLAGGCFWGVQGVFQHVKGVTNAVSGYAGGEKSTAHYETVGTGTTGHAEAIKITYDPRQISYSQILQIYFSVAHDPTQLNRQEPDVGTQYRSAIFPTNSEQRRIATAYIAQLNQAHVFNTAIVTGIEPERVFYPAEGYHQDFLTRNPSHPYILIYDLPKIKGLKQLFPDLYRVNPMLVSAARA